MLRRFHRCPRCPAPSLVAIAFGVGLGLGLAACGGQEEAAPPPQLPTEWGDASVLGGGPLLTYDFTLGPEALDELATHPLSERFVAADLTVTGQPVGPVGLRYKGLGGNLASCFEEGQQVCEKVSFKVKFDHLQAGGSFEGVTRLNLHAVPDDPSQLRERLAARLFAEMGLIAPRVNHAFVIINGERKGVFAVVEEVDARFTGDRWPTAGMGNLYREAWPLEGDPEAYDANLETNLGVRDNRRMAAFGQAMRTATAGEPLRSALDRFASIEYLLRFLAVDQVIKNEGITTFYCDNSGACGNSNYYWYETATGALPAESRFWLVPWEMGGGFRLQGPLDVVPAWDKPPANCNLRVMVEDARLMPPGCDVVFRALQTAGRAAWVKALDQLLLVWNVDALGRQLDQWAGQIALGTELDPVGPGRAAFEAGVRSLKRDLQAFRQRIVALRDDTPVVAFSLAAPGSTNFEETATLPFVLGVSSESNSRTGVVHLLNDVAPLAGSIDLRFDFELANDVDLAGRPQPFSQFALLRLPLPGITPLPDLAQIRLRIRADAIRNVRIEIDSAAPGSTPETPRYGWDVVLGKQPVEITLDAGKLALPAGAGGGGPGLEAVLEAVQALIITPEPRGRSGNGLFDGGKTDRGFLHLDDLHIEVQ